MNRHHYGSGRRTAVPEDWESSFGTVVTAQWDTEATVALRKPGGETGWSESAGRTVTTPYTPFADDVPARIQPITAEQVNVVEEVGWVLGYRVVVPRNQSPTPAQLDEGIEIVVRTCSDPMLVGVTMRVTEVVRGTHRFERELVARVNS